MEVAEIVEAPDDLGLAPRRDRRDDLRAPHRLSRGSAAGPDRRAARRPGPAARHLRRPHGPDLRERAAARGRRGGRHRRAGAGRRGARAAGRGRRRRCRRAADRAVRDGARRRGGRGGRPDADAPRPPRRALASTALDPDAGDVAVALKTRWRHGAGDRGRGRRLPVPWPLLRAGPRAAPAPSAGHRHRPGLLHRRRRRARPRRRVPPQRARRALRADRAGTARYRPPVGPGTALGRDRAACCRSTGMPCAST